MGWERWNRKGVAPHNAVVVLLRESESCFCLRSRSNSPMNGPAFAHLRHGAFTLPSVALFFFGERYRQAMPTGIVWDVHGIL